MPTFVLRSRHPRLPTPAVPQTEEDQNSILTITALEVRTRLREESLRGWRREETTRASVEPHRDTGQFSTYFDNCVFLVFGLSRDFEVMLVIAFGEI